MPIAKKEDNAEIKKVAVSNTLASDAVTTLNSLSQMTVQEKSGDPSATRHDTEVQQEEIKTVTIPAEDEEDESEKGKKYSDTVIARLSKGKRAEFKSFFSRYGITMNSGIEMCIEYVIEQVEEGKAKISKAGVK